MHACFTLSVLYIKVAVCVEQRRTRLGLIPTVYAFRAEIKIQNRTHLMEIIWFECEPETHANVC